MAYYNPDDFKFGLGRHNLKPEPAGFKIPSLDIPDYQSKPFDERTNFAMTPADRYYSMDALDDNVDSDFSGIDASWKRHTFEPSGLYGRGAGGIGSARISDRETPRPAFGTLAQRMGASRRYGGSYGGGVKSLGAQESYSTPTIAKPTMGAMPTFNMPKMDRGRISELTEIGMGAPLGKLRSGLGRALVESRYSSNPNVRALQKKRALSGYGTGISDIRLGAHRTAMGEYMPEFQAATQKAGAEYQGGINRMNLQFQADMNEYFKTMKSTSKKVPTAGLSKPSPYPKYGTRIYNR